MEASARLVQLSHPDEGHRVALVDQGQLRLLASFRSAYAFAKTAIETGYRLRDLLSTDLSGVTLPYEEVHARRGEWRFLASFDHPEPARCLVSACGKEPGQWNYLGSGGTLKGHGETLLIREDTICSWGDVAAVYMLGVDGSPRRVGVSLALHFGGASRSTILGPELILDPELASVDGHAKLIRNGNLSQEHGFSSQGGPLLYALAALEPEHFAYPDHHRAWDAHVHLTGERLFRNRGQVALQPGDRLEFSVDGLGLPCVLALEPERREERRLVAIPL